MIEKYKRRFRNVLQRMEALPDDSSSLTDDAVERFFAYSEDEIRDIRKKLTAKKDNLRILSAILSLHGGDGEDKEKEGFRLPVSKAMANIDEFKAVGMTAKLASWNIRKGEMCLDGGSVERALDLWESVLKVDPTNTYVHKKLSQLSERLFTSYPKVSRLMGEYRLNYLGSFGQGAIRRPLSMSSDWRGEGLLVSDYETSGIFHFDSTGSSVRLLDVVVKQPMGIFKDECGLVWVCERGANCLIALDSSEKIVDSISLDTVFKDSAVSRVPAYGCQMGKYLFLILMDEFHQNRRIVAMETANPSKWEEIWFGRSMMLPDGIKAFDSRIFMADIEAGMLFTYDVLGVKLSIFANKGPIPKAPRRCTMIRDNIFYTAGKTIVKCALNGDEIFSADLSGINGAKEIQPLEMASLEKDGNLRLFVSDVSAVPRIHVFEV